MKHTLICGLLGALLAVGQVAGVSAQSEELRLRLENRPDGVIAVSRDEGRQWLEIGRVVSPATAVNRHGFNASRWVPDSSVAATAVNAIHLTVSKAADTGYGITFSLVPAGDAPVAAVREARSAIHTDMAAGTGLFGGLGPYVASPVYLQTADTLRPLPADYSPAEGDVLVITRLQPARPLRYIDFVNEFGGDITVTYDDGSQEVIGQVLRPVGGIGRFEGSRDAAPGRIRANHAGVIDISTSPLGLIGGFQIISADHANDPELYYVKSNLQWMIVGPHIGGQRWSGVAPLFAGNLYPSYRPDDIIGGHADWLERTLSRCQVLAKVGDGDWGLLPRIALDPEAPAGAKRPAGEGLWRIRASADVRTPLPGAAQTALSTVRAIRIVLPSDIFWPQ